MQIVDGYLDRMGFGNIEEIGHVEILGSRPRLGEGPNRQVMQLCVKTSRRPVGHFVIGHGKKLLCMHDPTQNLHLTRPLIEANVGKHEHGLLLL